MIKSRYLYTLIAALTAQVTFTFSASADMYESHNVSCIFPVGSPEACMPCVSNSEQAYEQYGRNWSNLVCGTSGCDVDFYETYGTTLTDDDGNKWTCREPLEGGVTGYWEYKASSSGGGDSGGGNVFCDPGDYWDWEAESGYGACFACPVPGISDGMSNKDYASEDVCDEMSNHCYVPSGTVGNDGTGTFQILDGSCPYSCEA